MKKEQQSSEQIADDEIDLLELIRPVWNERKFILKIVLLFFFLGLLTAILAPKEFTASSTFIPQTESLDSGSLGGLASLAGLNLSSMGAASEIPPALYPQIIKSVKFKRALLETPLILEEKGTKTTYKDFYENHYNPGILKLLKKYTIGLPSLLKKNFRKKEAGIDIGNHQESPRLIRLSETEVQHFERLESQIHIESNESEGTVELSFVMPEALMAAQMAKSAEELLHEEVIDFKIQNAKEQLKFTEIQFEQKRIAFEQKQKELANFRDRNQNISSAMAMNRLQRLEADYNFAFNIYTELAKQLEQTKLQVSKDTPIFSVINPVSIPSENSSPNRILILVSFLAAGLILSVGYIFLKQFLESIRNLIN